MKKQILSITLVLMTGLSLVSVLAVPAQAASGVKLGKYSNDAVKGEFIWHIILKDDNTFELRTGDYEGIYDDTGTWAIDSSGNITADIVDIGTVKITVGDGVLTLWGAPLYYNETATTATPTAPSASPGQ